MDDEKRQILFSASGMYPGKDPYFVDYYRINFDGTGLTRLTAADANHAVTFSPDRHSSSTCIRAWMSRLSPNCTAPMTARS